MLDSDSLGGIGKAMRVLLAAILWSVALLAAAPDPRAAEPSAVWKDGWTINTPGGSNWLSDGTASLFYSQGAPSAPYTPGLARDPYAFADYSIGHTLRFGRDYGLGDMQATLGARMAEPLARNELTPAFDPRRYLGVGPRIGLEGNKPLQSSWIVEWKVGASVLSTDRTFDTGGGVANLLPSNTASSSSALNVDGLLGLSYWFDSAAKLTVGYRADYFKTSPTFNITGPEADSAINHGPLIRFSIQK
jgi:hypothetical protein